MCQDRQIRPPYRLRLYPPHDAWLPSVIYMVGTPSQLWQTSGPKAPLELSNITWIFSRKIKAMNHKNAIIVHGTHEGYAKSGQTISWTSLTPEFHPQKAHLSDVASSQPMGISLSRKQEAGGDNVIYTSTSFVNGMTQLSYKSRTHSMSIFHLPTPVEFLIGSPPGFNSWA